MIARVKAQRNTYLGYSVGCAAVWAAILAVANRQPDPKTRDTVRLVCGGWWTGWASATIARIVYPPPKKLTVEAEKRLQIGSLALIALGLLGVIRLLFAGRRTS